MGRSVENPRGPFPALTGRYVMQPGCLAAAMSPLPLSAPGACAQPALRGSPAGAVSLLRCIESHSVASSNGIGLAIEYP